METTPRNRPHLRLVILLVLAAGGLAPTQGCVAAAVGAGAGIAGTAYFTSRGVKSVVKGSVPNLASRTRVVMAQMDIPLSATKSEKEGTKREFQGTSGNLDVTVTLERNDGQTTTVEVDARRNLVSWDKDFAKSLLDRIIATQA